MEGDLSVGTTVDQRMTTIYWDVANRKCSPGTPRKTMDAIVAKVLKIALWRSRAMRLGEAGCASAAYFCRVQEEHGLFMQEQARAAAAKAASRIHRDRTELEAARHELRYQLAKVERLLASCEAALRLPDED